MYLSSPAESRSRRPASLSNSSTSSARLSADARQRQFGHDAQGQRQPGGALGQRGRGVGLGRHPLAQQGAQQRDGVAAGQQVEADPAGAVPGDQGRQRVAAGHQHHARALARQQVAHLDGRLGVVEQDEQPPPGHGRAVPRRPLGLVERDGRAVHTELAQEVLQGLGRADRPVRVVAAQVDVELAVRELTGHPVGPVHGQRGLAHARRPGQHADPGPVAGLGQQLVQFVQLGRAAGEADDVGRQVPGHAGPRRRRRCRRRNSGRPGRGLAVGQRAGGGQPQPVEVLGIPAECLDDELQQTPARDPRLGERGRDRGVTAADLAAHVAQARPAGPVVQFVQFVEQHANRTVGNARFRQSSHRRSPA